MPETHSSSDKFITDIGAGATNVNVGETIHQTNNQTFYQVAPAQPADAVTRAAAQAMLAELPLDVVPPVATLPSGSRLPLSPNPLFVGRDEALKKLAGGLKGEASDTLDQVRIAVVTGWGGLGKTQLAVEFAHRYGRYFAGGVFWLNFATADGVPAQVALCGGRGALNLGVDFVSLALDEQVKLVQAAWQNGLPYLLIFDNCEEGTLLATWRPPSGSCRILITSRRTVWDKAFAVQSLPLGLLPRNASIDLLQRFLTVEPAVMNTPPIEIPGLDEIAEELGDLPLALHLAGSFLARYRHAVTPKTYLKELRNPKLLHHPSLTAGRQAQQSPTKHEIDVARTFALSYDQLQPKAELDGLALTLLARAVCFAPGVQIPRSWLLMQRVPRQPVRGLAKIWNAWFGRARPSPSYVLAADALTRLCNLGLLEENQQGDLRLHRLIAFYVGDITPHRVALEQTAIEKFILQMAERQRRQGDVTPLISIYPHLRHLAQQAQLRLDERSAQLWNVLGYLAEMIRNQTDAKEYHQRAQDIRQIILGEIHPDTADSYTALGDKFYTAFEWRKAKFCYEQALVIRHQVLGEQHSDTAQSLDNLGALLQAQGELATARPYLEQALTIRQIVFGDQHPDTAQSLNNLGYLLYAQGELTAAQPYYEQAVAIRLTVLGDQHPDTANSLNNLGTLLQAQGKLAAAQPYYEQALTIRLTVLGDQHLDTAISLNSLGYLLQVQGHLATARPYYEQALTIQRTVLGDQHPNTAHSLNSLGGLLHAQGELTAARPYFQQALAIYRTVLGDQHPNTATSLNNLGYLLQAQGELAAAQPYYEQALTIRQTVLGDQHPDTASSLNSLGTLLQAQGELAAAQPYYEQALAIRLTVLGDQHPDTANSLNNLDYLLQVQGYLATARPYYEQALASLEKQLGSQHSTTRFVRGNLEALVAEIEEKGA